jgi:cell division protein FtsL
MLRARQNLPISSAFSNSAVPAASVTLQPTATGLSSLDRITQSIDMVARAKQARREENDIQIEWRQLLLERSTLSSHARVEQIAAEQLQMTLPVTELPVTVAE